MCNNIPAIVEYIKHRRKSAEALYIPMSRSQFIDEAKWKSMSDYIDYSKYSSHISCVHFKNKLTAYADLKKGGGGCTAMSVWQKRTNITP